MTSKELEQINIKIAKKLGWKAFKKEYLPSPLQKEKRMTGIAPGNFRRQYVPNYTSNFAYSLQLVDWATKHEYSFELTKSNDGPYEVQLSNWKTIYFGKGILPSMAICMAFVGIK